MENLYYEPLVALIEAAKARQKNLKCYHDQIKPILEEYAAGILDLPVEGLTAGHLLDAKGRLRGDLSELIDSKTWLSRYKQEKKSRVKKVVRMALEDAAEQRRSPSTPVIKEADMPEPLSGLWPLLPKVNGRLTDEGTYLVNALNRVARKNSLSTHELLLTDLAPDVRLAIKNSSVCPPSRWFYVEVIFYRVRKKSGVPVGRKPRRCLALEDFPSPLREQVLTAKENAKMGIKHEKPLGDRASALKVNVGKRRASTMNQYEVALGKALYWLDHSGDLSVEDLLALDDGEYEFAGVTSRGKFNARTNLIRERERALVTGRKAENFDSPSFKNYVSAVKAVGALNGEIELVAKFRGVYSVPLDSSLGDKAKDEKKETFVLKWIDGVIAALKLKYDLILKDRVFEPPKKGVGKLKAYTATRFCLFFVILVTLRYMGFRQQAIRECVHGRNIRFYPKVIEFFWPKEKVKNCEEIKVKIRGEDADGEIAHRGTHGVLLDTLNSYNQILYPYIKKQAAKQGVDLQGQFFVRLTLGGRFERYPADTVETEVITKDGMRKKKKLVGHVLFRQIFMLAALRYIDFGTLLDGVRVRLNPHFFRGLVMDWLYYDLRLPIVLIADYLGDNEQTLITYYKKKNKLRDGTQALDEVSRRRADIEDKRKLREDVSALTSDMKELKGELGQNSKAVKAAEKSAEEERAKRVQAEQLAARYEAENAALQAVVESQKAQILSLTQQQGSGDQLSLAF